jgi:hypothetical protein
LRLEVGGWEKRKNFVVESKWVKTRKKFGVGSG